MKLFEAFRRRPSKVEAQLHKVEEKLNELVVGMANLADLLNRKFDQLLAGLDNQSDLQNQKFEQMLLGGDNQNDLINRKLGELIAAVENQSDVLTHKLELVFGASSQTYPKQAPAQNLREAMEHLPLLFAEGTYNIFHPDYEPKLVRSHPGTIFNRQAHCTNLAYAKLLKQAQGTEVSDSSWGKILADSLVESAAITGASSVFERLTFVDDYLIELDRKYKARYIAGGVNLQDALFLYWLVRQTCPRNIVQSGAGNGLSSAFIMLALAKNGLDGELIIIDQPQVFDHSDPGWTIKGMVYGGVIPEGKTSAWMVPDCYRNRLKIWNGDPKVLLPRVIDSVEIIDVFYHGSNQPYQRMMFEFEEVKRKLAQGGLIVAVDVGWNASLWDFAEKFGVPSYTFKAGVGVAFF